MSNYTSTYPTDTKVDPGIKTFFEEFYKISDTPNAHDLYAQQFTKDAVLVMASKRCEGSDEILTLRKGMWEKVAARHHNPLKIFPFGSGSEELMLHGTVDYELKDGKKAKVDWAAKADMAKEEGKWKMKFYQVYLDTAAMANAK
ncbi:NTF2-like protein [Glarea lozoyensis ATCC 20868]|uniref:NTF2-like protein n=1 Tax=Glarea lozoyensis (strain ATCC 20868 / MF5171) TaxID=1116229 RepID=S3DGH8_GLAL2|nr:NTF2-like protein [Glarea lozoyensis ATCC 20868]EPE36775.1 NTF2-like protein [Glarea lozoyensis ATCC 20868]